MNIAPISEPKTIRPAQAATQKVGRAAVCEVVERVRGAPLPDVEADEGRARDDEQDDRQGGLVRDRREVDPEDERADQDDREDAAEIVDGLGRLVDVARHELDGHHERDHGERQGEQEHRSPPEVLEQDPGAQRPERGDRARRSRPTARSPSCGTAPAQSAVISARVVGYAMPAASPPRIRAQISTSSVGAHAGEAVGRDRQQHPEDEQQLAPVPVADRAEVQDRGGEPEGVADRDQVQRGLRRVEGVADRRQRDVGDREAEVGDRRDGDQRAEDDARPRGGRAAVTCSSRSRYAFRTSETEA